MQPSSSTSLGGGGPQNEQTRFHSLPHSHTLNVNFNLAANNPQMMSMVRNVPPPPFLPHPSNGVQNSGVFHSQQHCLSFPVAYPYHMQNYVRAVEQSQAGSNSYMSNLIDEDQQQIRNRRLQGTASGTSGQF